MDLWSNEALPPARQFVAWRERLGLGRNPARAERNGLDEAPFPAQVRLTGIGSRDMLTIRAPAHRLELRARGELDGGDVFALYIFSPARLETAAGETELPAESVLLIDPRAGGALIGHTEVHYGSVRVSRQMLEAHLDPGRWSGGATVLFASDPVGGLVCGFAAGLIRNASAMPKAEGDALLDALCRLLAIGVGQADPDRTPHPHPVRAARLARMKRLILTRLAECDLSPAGVGAAFGMSPRGVHMLFEGSGQTFSSYVTARRLAGSRAMLADPSQSGRSIADIAFTLGFGNVSTFYRAFRSAYGMTPIEARQSWVGRLN